MNVKQDITSDTRKADAVPYLILLKPDGSLLTDDPGKLTERRMQEMDRRATVLGPVMEAILREQHGQPRWGLNE
jgi:hypothetical protein